MSNRKTVTVQGMRFTVKPTTRVNVNKLKSHFDDPSDEVLAMDEFEQHVELLRVITDPEEGADYGAIDVDNFDIKIAQDALMSFMPTLMPTYGGLIGSSRF